MMRRTSLIIIAFAVFAAACSGGAGGALNELLDQVRLDDPLSARTYAENREVIEVPASIPLLSEYLANDPSPKVRQYCALILGRIGDAEAVPALANALSDDDAGVRDRAVAALNHISEDEAEDAFIAALSSDSRGTKIAVLVELERAGSVKAVPSIVEVAMAGDGIVSKNALDALGGIGDVSAIAALVGMALDADMAENLRRAAIMNLGRVDGPEANAGLQEVIAGLDEQDGVDDLVQYARDHLQ